MQLNKEETEEFALILSLSRKSSFLTDSRIFSLLQSVLKKEDSEIFEFYLNSNLDIDLAEKLIFENIIENDIFNAKIAACRILHLDRGIKEYFNLVAKILLMAVKYNKIIALVKELDNLSCITSLSNKTRVSLIAWLFSQEDILNSENIIVFRSNIFFRSDDLRICENLIRLEAYEEVLHFLVENTECEFREYLARVLPKDYLIHLMDSDQNTLEIIEERLLEN